MKHWKRLSDNAASQFKCQFVVNNLLNVQKNVSSSLESVDFCYFESNEGKNLSDTVGSLVKQAIARETLRTTEGVGDDSPDQRLAIAEELKRCVLAGLNIEDEKCGAFSFFR